MLYIDLEKSISRKDAKAKHPDLPPGGVWRTIKGHHVYIKDGKVVAGAGVGKTGKPIKLTKTHLAAHQAHVDKEAAKTKPKKPTAKATTKTAKTVKKAPTKAPTKATTKAAAPKKTIPKPKKKTTTAVVPSSIHYHTANANKETGKMTYQAVEGATKANVDGKGREYFYHTEKRDKSTLHRISEAESGLLVAIGKTKAQAHTIAQERIDAHHAKIEQLVTNHVAAHGKSPYSAAPTKTAKTVKKTPTKKPKAEVKKVTPKPKKQTSKKEPIEIYHGTHMANISTILNEGFKLNGSTTDFGHAAYFKSPQYDQLDHADYAQTIEDFREKNGDVPKLMLQRRGYDTQKVVKNFASRTNSAIIKAVIPSDRVLDCSKKGRPPELEALLRGKYGPPFHFSTKQKMLLEYVVGEKTEKLTTSEVTALYEQHKDHINKQMGREINLNKLSPYEVYAHKYKLHAIVDKLTEYSDEGWQIGVYNPEIIQIVDHGKDIEYDENTRAVKLRKALLKAMQQAPKNRMGYTLLHYEMTDEGLVMHVGAYNDMPITKGAPTMKVYNVNDLHIVNEEKLVKSTLTGGEWRTIRGRHVYIKDGTIMTGNMKGKKLSELGSTQSNDKGANDNGSNKQTRTTGQQQASSVGEKTGTNQGGNHKGLESGGQDAGGNRTNHSHVRALSKKEIPARNEREYTFHRLSGKEGADAFHKAILASKAGNDHGAFVHAYEAHEYEGQHLFLSEGGEAGFTIKSNGDICSVFHNPKLGTKKGVLGHCMELALQHGGNRLDCFDGFLPKQYAKWGFEPLAKVKFNREYAPEGWNFERDGEPDVLFFAHNGDSLEKVLNTNYPSADLSKTPYIEDYDDGVAYQDAYLEGRRSPVAKSLGMQLEIMKSISRGW